MKNLNDILNEQISTIPLKNKEFDQTFIKQVLEKDSSLIEQKYDFIKTYVFLEQEEEKTKEEINTNEEEKDEEDLSDDFSEPPIIGPYPNMYNFGMSNQNMLNDDPIDTNIPKPKDFVYYIKLSNQIEFLEDQKELYSKYGKDDKQNKYIQKIDKILAALNILADNIDKYTVDEISDITNEIDKFINIISKKKGEE